MSHVLPVRSESCLLAPEAYTAQWCQQESCMSKQAILSSNEIIWLFCIVYLNCKGVLHKLHVSFQNFTLQFYGGKS